MLTRVLDKEVKRDKPLPAVYPDRQNENFPIIPELGESPVLAVGRKVIWTYVSAMWRK